MKLKWIAETREVPPPIGLKNAGDIFEAPEDIALSLISQKLAVKIKEERSEK